MGVCHRAIGAVRVRCAGEKWAQCVPESDWRSACAGVSGERWAQCVCECAKERWRSACAMVPESDGAGERLEQCVWECAGERCAQCVWDVYRRAMSAVRGAECAGER